MTMYTVDHVNLLSAIVEISFDLLPIIFFVMTCILKIFINTKDDNPLEPNNVVSKQPHAKSLKTLIQQQ